MGHGRCTFKQGELTRVLRAVKKAGARVARAELGDGKIVLHLEKDSEAPSVSERNEWDEIDGED
jgi:hypothetical protein